MFDWQAPKGSLGKCKRAVWDTRIDDPFGRPTRMPLDVEDLLVHGVIGPIKRLVQTELTMVRVLGTKVRGAVVFATLSFYSSTSTSASDEDYLVALRGGRDSSWDCIVEE